MVSMWAAFGHVDTIPPLAFAVPAMFAKSSTIYNPIIYLMLRPNFRRMVQRDLSILCRTCLKRCHCSKGQDGCCSKPELGIRLHTLHRQTNQFPSSNYSAQPPVRDLHDCSCRKGKDAFESCRHYPQVCVITNPDANRGSSKDVPGPPTHAPKTQRECCGPLLSILRSNRTSEIDNVHIRLEMTPGHAKLAWP